MVLLWVVGYGAVYTAAQWLSSSVPVGGLIVSGLMAAYCVLLFLWSWRYNREKNICLNAVNWKKLIKDPAILSLLLLPMYNLMTGGYVEHSVQKIVLILSVALIEELFFRGYLLNYLKNQGRLLAVIASSAIFALMHGANFCAGMELRYVLMQMLTAFLTGICYGTVTLRQGSLVPGMAAHFLTNITADKMAVCGFALFIIAEGIWCFWFCYDIWKKERQDETVY